MPPRRRPADVGAEHGRVALASLIREEVLARRDRGLSLSAVAGAVGLSSSTLSRIEAGKVSDVGVIRLSALLGVVGLQVSARAYPGGNPLREAGHARVLLRFRARLHRDLGWAVEVPLPIKGDLRAWDGFIRGTGWRYGVEVETRPTDAQALPRRVELKVRDSGVSGVILVVPDTRHVRAFLAAAGEVLRPTFPVAGRRALELLGAGVDPGRSAIVVL